MYRLIRNPICGLRPCSWPLLSAPHPLGPTCKGTNTSPAAALSVSRRQQLQNFHHTAGFRQTGHSYLRPSRVKLTPGKFADTSNEAPKSATVRPGSVLADMLVTMGMFEVQRPKLLEKLRNSTFVAFDLEFSGIGKPREPGKYGGLRMGQTLQECYASTKEVVEMYQLLQVGLCPVEWKEEDQTYVASPVNLYVSPIVTPQSLGIDRVFSLQSSTLSFLVEHNFNFNTQLRYGVPYLSREEEQKIINSWEAEERKRERDLLMIDPNSQQFADDCIKALEEWEKDPDAPWDFINITTDRNIMSNYQRLIVHHIVKTKFPKLTSQGRGTFVCVTRTDEQAAQKKKAETKHTFDGQLDSAIGLRHIIDELFEPKRPDKKKIVLVGHNCFMDLLHLYNCFFGKLPKTVEEFAELMSKSFPIIIDTKHLATYGDSSPTANSASTLRILESLLRPQTNPRIDLHPEYSDYKGEGQSFHEAGYDAYITAIIFIRLAARLAHEGGLQLPPPQLETQSSQSDSSNQNSARDIASEAKDYVLMEVDGEIPLAKDHGVGLAGAAGMGQQQQTHTPVTFLSLGTDENDSFQDDVKQIPNFHEDQGGFWNCYINQLRMFGTSEGVLRLPGKARSMKKDKLEY